MFHDFLLFSQFHGKAPQLMPRGCSIINSCTSLFLQQKRRRREHIKRRGELEEKKLQRNSELEEKDWYCLTYDDAEDDYMISAWILWTAGCAFAQENNRKQSRARKPRKKTAGHALNPYYRCSLHLLNEIAKKLLRVLQKSWHLMQLGSGSANVPPQLYNTLCGFTGNRFGQALLTCCNHWSQLHLAVCWPGTAQKKFQSCCAWTSSSFDHRHTSEVFSCMRRERPQTCIFHQLWEIHLCFAGWKSEQNGFASWFWRSREWCRLGQFFRSSKQKSEGGSLHATGTGPPKVVTISSQVRSKPCSMSFLYLASHGSSNSLGHSASGVGNVIASTKTKRNSKGMTCNNCCTTRFFEPICYMSILNQFLIDGYPFSVEII